MKLRTALLAGIGLIGGAALLPLTAGAQTSTTTGTPGGAGTNAPASNNSGAIHTPSSTGSGSMAAPGSGSYGASGSSTMGSTTASGGSTMGSNTTMRSDDVLKLQQALNDNGESVKVDGVMGPNTEKALRDYQQKNGLQASGQLDSQTRQKLNLGG